MQVDEAQLDPIAVAVARNDAAFRSANEDIARTAAELAVDDGLLPFICECADASCTTIVQLTATEYRAVRDRPTQFLNASGHEGNCLGWGRVIGDFGRYTLLEKIGDAAVAAVALDAGAGGPS